MAQIKCFFLEPTNRRKQALRRFSYGANCAAQPEWGHDAETPIEDGPVLFNAEGLEIDRGAIPPKDDPRWPTACQCGYVFDEHNDRWQLFTQRIYVRIDTGEETTLYDAPPGAMWFADWYTGGWKGPDGHRLVVKTPAGDWIVDQRASNCTRKDDSEHRCWVRHGDPRTGQVTVDKNGLTCNAGAGSILIGSYHGFLRNGFLVDA